MAAGSLIVVSQRRLPAGVGVFAPAIVVAVVLPIADRLGVGCGRRRALPRPLAVINSLPWARSSAFFSTASMSKFVALSAPPSPFWSSASTRPGTLAIILARGHQRQRVVLGLAVAEQVARGFEDQAGLGLLGRRQVGGLSWASDAPAVMLVATKNRASKHFPHECRFLCLTVPVCVDRLVRPHGVPHSGLARPSQRGRSADR